MSTNVVLPPTIATAVTAAGALAAGKHNRVDATSGPLTMTLPAAIAGNAGAALSVEKIDVSGNAVTVSGPIRGATSTLTLVWQFETIEFIADATGSWYPVAGHKTKAALDAAYDAKGAAAAVTLSGLGGAPLASPALTGTPTAPTPTPGDSTTKIATTAFAATLFGTTLLVGRSQQSGTAYTFVLADAGTEVEASNASAVIFTVPLNSAVAFPVGSVIQVRQYGAGQVTIAPTAGVTLRSRGGALKTYGQYAGAVLTKRATDEWFVDGDLA